MCLLACECVYFWLLRSSFTTKLKCDIFNFVDDKAVVVIVIFYLIPIRKCIDSTNTMAVFNIGSNFTNVIRLEAEGGQLQWCSVGCYHRNYIIIGEPCIFSMFGNILLFIVASHQVSQSNKTEN